MAKRVFHSKMYTHMLTMMKSTNSLEASSSTASQTVATSYHAEGCKWYWSVCEHLTLDEDLIVYGCRLLILSEM